MKNVFGLFAILALFTACSSEQSHVEEKAEITKAVAVIHSINDSEVAGVAYFEKVETGVHVRAEVTGLSGEKHGFHIHTFGDCTADDGTSTGGHFNPDGMEHGSPDMLQRHMGAMGNLEVNEQGIGIRDYIDQVIDINEIIGRGIIVHGGEDDLVSQPSGASGPRIGCGVIGIQN